METIIDFGDQWIRNILNEIKTKNSRCLLALLNDYSNKYSDLLQSSAYVSKETQRLRSTAYGVFKTLF